MKKLLLLLIVMSGVVKQSHSQNLNLTLASQLSYPSQTLSNIHGWVDTTDGKEYALVGAQNGLSIVDVSNPAAPVQITQIPGPPSTWREIKTWGDYAYVTTEDGTIGLQIVELTNLPATNLAVTTWKPLIGIDSLETIHALHIDNGKVYLYGSNVGNGGAIIADIVTTPLLPIYLGSYDPRYVHDGYVRNDTMYSGHIYDGECAIVDATNPASPLILATFQTPGAFTHNTWLSANSKICFTTDEIADSYLASFDISNLGNISELDKIQTAPGSGAVVHNTHIVQNNNNDYAVTSWYTEGLTIVDAGRPGNLVEVGHYDTSPLTASSGMEGDWGVYPFFPSGTIVASDMQEGLFVFTPTYVRACYLEGAVTDCNTGNPISGVDVTIQMLNPPSDANTDITDFAGQYAVGVAAPDTYTVVFSKVGYFTDTDTVVLSSGVVTIDSFQLCPLPIFSYGGFIFDNATSAGIPNASVSIYDASSRWDTITDASGNFSIPTMYSGTYSIAAGKWGYVTQCLNAQSVSPTAPAVNMGLDTGIYDDFIFNFGWTVSGNALEGIWERGEPLGTSYSSTLLNAGNDNTTDCGVEAYVTGNNGLSYDDDDVDGGVTILTSPTFDLSGYINPYVYYSRWKAIYFGASDSVSIILDNGITSVIIEKVLVSSTGQSAWVNRNYKVAQYITPTATMKFIVRASDNGADDVVEAGIDKFYIAEVPNSAVNEITNAVQVLVYPNPFSESATVEVTGNQTSLIGGEFKLYDMYGREVYRLPMTDNRLLFTRGNLSAGIYFYRITNDKAVIATGKLCVD